MNIFGKQSNLRFLRKSDRKKEQEQTIICSQTQLDGIALEQTIICRLLFAGHIAGSRPIYKGRKMASSDNYFCFSGSRRSRRNWFRERPDIKCFIVFIGFLYYNSQFPTKLLVGP